MANEKMRLINANALKERLKELQDGDWVVGLDMAESLVDEMPTVDAVEVVHGRWQRTDYPEFCKGDFECSVCEHLECDIDTSVLMPGVNCLFYCPNCGAKMDGDPKIEIGEL